MVDEQRPRRTSRVTGEGAFRGRSRGGRRGRRVAAPLWVTGALAALAGCGEAGASAAAGSDDGGVGEAASALGAPSWFNPECSEAALESPPGRCDGPWRFTWSSTCNNPAICGTSTTCAAYNACATYEAGIATSSVTENPSAGYAYTCKETCTGAGYVNCSTTCTGSEPGAKCASAASARKSAIVATVPATAPGYATWLGGFAVAPQVNVVDETTTTTGGSFGKPLITTTKTDYKCRLNIPKFPKPAVGPAASCGCKTYEPKTCVCETDTVDTTPAPDAAAPTSAGPGRAFVTPPVCLTCDDADFGDDPADATAMLACLDDRLGGAAGQLARTRVARSKLVLQLAGDRLDAASRAGAEELYETPAFDASAPACQAPLALEAKCAQSGETSGLPLVGKLQLCADLRAAHVPVGVVRAELAHCLTVFDDVAQLAEGGACRAPLRDQAADIIADLFRGAAAGYDASDGLAGDLLETAGQIDAWYAAAERAAGADREWLRARASEVAGRVWRGAHDAARRLPTAAGSDAEAAALLADVAGTGLEADWAMINALFDAGQPLDAPPLMFLLADALRGTLERLERAAPVHDVACRFAGCAPASPGGRPRATALSQAFRAVAAVGDRAALGAALAGAGALEQQHPAFVAALRAVRDRHGALERAWAAAAPAAPIASLAATGAAVPPEAEELAAVTRSARSRAASYAATGRFDAARPRLNAAVLKREQLVGFLDYNVGQLDAAAQAHEGARLETVNDLLAQARAEGGTQSVLDRAVVSAFEARGLVERLAGLRERDAAERASLGEFMAAFEGVVQSGAFDADAAYQVDTLPPLTVRPADARFRPGDPFDPAAIRAHLVPLVTGQVLDVDALDGTWSPTCALDVAQIASPLGSPADVSVAGAVTGPEGFFLSWSNTHYRTLASTHTSGSSSSTTASFELCSSIGLNFPPGGASPLSVSTTLRNCLSQSWSLSNSNSSSNSTGQDSRVTASFNGGVRLPFVPVPEAPVGSLLAVLTVAGQPQHVLDVRVVNRRDAILAPALDPAVGTKVDVHFVVNDVTGVGCAPPVNDALQLSLRVVTPAGLVAKALGAAMAEALADVEAQAPAVIAQGGLLPNDAGALRAGAWGRLTQRLAAHGHGLQGLPPELRNLYDAWLEKAIAGLGRRGEIDRVQRDIERVGLDVQALEHELANGEEQSRLLALIPRWRLRDLAGVRLRPAVDALGEALSDYAAPIFELRDPARLTGFRQSANAQLGALLALDFARPLDETADDLRLLAVAARNSLAAAEFELPANARRTVVLAFPREPGACDGLCDEFRQAPAQAAELFWRGVEGPDHEGQLLVRPADLYAPSGGNAQLSCHDLAPVVRRAAVYALNPQNTSIDFAALGRELPAAAGAGDATFAFPTAGALVSLAAETPAGVPLSLPVINGPGGDVLTDFGPTGELGAGAGVSPFGAFSVDFGSFYTSAPTDFIGTTQAVLLVLEVERRLSPDKAFVPGPCLASFSP